jgi:hypothetical protein
MNPVVDGGRSLGIGLSFGKAASFPERRGTYDHDTDHRIE